ncbi:uncharacterized protein LOC111632192 [Centruroides sculpturatus]|uniref:uncharacterized protein LOC111632178 n=1 Tax=Centruroides sculpturatus TaxID=218467 RepID=UPI000C6C8AD7|nr:uncharacterized protein LOC111632178 [Centruroides sculpturatus]XP_023232334.1 uncharacterized protein LOC111632192 [Centruroides sculpturatus]
MSMEDSQPLFVIDNPFTTKKRKSTTKIDDALVEKKKKYDLVISKDESSFKSIPPYSIYISHGFNLEIKEFRQQYYICLAKTTAKGEIQNRFNIPVKEVKFLFKL